MEIKQPVQLARLPRQLEENNPHKCGPVYGLNSGQKRKRHEVSVAIDGNAVNLYEVEHGSIKASYAIPPAASFVCSPTSVRVKTGQRTHTRYTYCATRRQGHQRLDCFQERFDNDQSQGITSSSATVAGHIGDVVHLEILSKPATTSAGTDEHIISVLFQSGVLRLYAQGLPREENAVQLAELHSSARCHDVLTVRWLTFDDVRGTTLKHRPDILASAQATSSFISVLYRQKTGLEYTAHVSVWSVPLTSTASTSPRLTDNAAIATYNLPDVQLWSQEADLQCSFTPKSTSLLVTGVRGIANFDFSSYSARVTWEENIPDHGLSSVRINNSFVATSSTTSLTIHDPKYKSSRTVLDLTTIGKKRKRESPASHGFVRIIGYFRELGKLVTVRRNHLLSFELSGAQKEAVLIDSIACGDLNSVKFEKGTALELEIGTVDDLRGIPSEQWTILQQKMTAAAEADDAASFEAVALEAVQSPDSLERLSEQQIEFLLSKIFRWRGDLPASKENQVHGQPYLQVAIPAFTVLSLLIDHGAVARHMVQYALRATHQAGKLIRVEAGMVPAALIESDRSFVLLKNFLDTPALLDAPELAATVGLLVKLVLSETYADRSTALSSRPLFDGDDVRTVEDGIEAKKVQLAATSEGNFDATDTELTSVLRIIVVVLEAFARFGTAAVAEELRICLNRTEIGTLIQILRQQLFEGQHTSFVTQGAYPSPPLSASSSLEDRVSDPVLSLDATSKILLGCIDAVGSLGFLADDSEDDFLARVIPELKSETALATQGLKEASYLRGLLRETMRYAQSADKDAFGDSTVLLTGDDAPAVHKPGTIITIYSEPTIDQGDIETNSGILPLSLRAENTVALTKMRKGGGQIKDRTLREVREIENRNKGWYSFERLVL